MDLVESLEHHLTNDRRHPWEQTRFEHIGRMIQRAAPLRPGDVIVDIGCGDGYISAELAKRYPSCTVCGVDTALTDEAVEGVLEAVNASNLHLFKSLNECEAFLGQDFASVILLLDVIEHVDDDAAFLRLIRSQRFCAESTVLLATVPAFAKLYSSRDKILGHYRRYNRMQLAAQMRAAGFATIEEQYFFLLPLLQRSMGVMAERAIGTKPLNAQSHLHWTAPGMVTRSMMALLRADLRLSDFFRVSGLHRSGLHLPGLSVCCICKPFAG